METSTQVQKSFNLKELTELVLELQAKIVALEAKINPPKTDSKEMTDEMAKRVIIGDLSNKSHKDAASALGLTYGQVYSARLEFTFKHIHKELAKTAGYKNKFVK